jgi:hypothetical protein
MLVPAVGADRDRVDLATRTASRSPLLELRSS